MLGIVGQVDVQNALRCANGVRTCGLALKYGERSLGSQIKATLVIKSVHVGVCGNVALSEAAIGGQTGQPALRTMIPFRAEFPHVRKYRGTARISD